MADITSHDIPLSADGKPRRHLSETLVMAAMCVVTVAFGAALYMQVGLTLWLTFIAALSLYVTLLTLHALVRRSDIVESLNSEIRRLEVEIARITGQNPAHSAVQNRNSHVASRAPVPPPLTPAKPVPPVAASAPPSPPGTEKRPPEARHADQHPQATHARQTSEVLPAAPQAAAPAAPTPPLRPQAPASEAPASPAFARPASPPPPVPAHEPWSFRPADPHLAPAHGDLPPPIPLKVDPAIDRIAASIRSAEPPALERPAPALDRPVVTAASSIRDADVEVIQGLIKKLADEVNAAEAAPQQSGATKLTEAAIETSLEALRATADTMRDSSTSAKPQQQAAHRAAEAPVRYSPPPMPGSNMENPPPLSDLAPWPAPISTSRQTQARISALSEAISARRADVLLEPILGLEDQRPAHYEVLLRLKSASGAPLESESLIEELRESGLLPMLDCTRIARVADVARRLADRSQGKAVFSEFSSESLADDQFLNDFANAYHERDTFAGQLVLTFTQAEIRALATREWATLEDMRDLGFRFALQSITDLDMDFEQLRTRGFGFVKLDADVFLEGLPATGGTVPAQDICRYLARLGLTLIVGKIDDEAKFARIFGFGALFGQGQLFGGPRLVKPEAASAARPRPSAHAAA